MNSKILLLSAAVALVTATAQAATTSEVVCSYAPSQSAIVNRITASTGGATAGAAAILKATGLSLVAHSSGAYILTGSGGYVAGTLLSPLVGPVMVTASVVAGSTMVLELSCAPRNHPDAIKSVKNITAKFNKAVRSANAKAVKVRDKTEVTIRELNERAIVERDAVVERVRTANDRAIVIRDGTARYIAGYF